MEKFERQGIARVLNKTKPKGDHNPAKQHHRKRESGPHGDQMLTTKPQKPECRITGGDPVPPNAT
jgi:hypothetical protein